MHKKNQYTLIVLKNYEQLRQIRCTPFTFWSILLFFILLLVLSITSLTAVVYTWRNAAAVRLEKDALYKKYVSTEARLNRLLTFESILLKESVGTTPENAIRPSKLKEQVQNNTTKKYPSNTAVHVKNTPSETHTSNNQVAKKDSSPEGIQLKNATLLDKNQKLLLSFELHNTQKKKLSGLITYTIHTVHDKTYNATAEKKDDSRYAIRSFKAVNTYLNLPGSLTPQEVQSVTIELSSQGEIILVKNIVK